MLVCDDIERPPALSNFRLLIKAIIIVGILCCEEYQSAAFTTNYTGIDREREQY